MRLWCSSMRCLTRSKERRAAETNAPRSHAALVGASSVLNGHTEKRADRVPVQVARVAAGASARWRGPGFARSRAPLGKVEAFQVPL